MKFRIEVETRDDVGLDAVVIEVRAEDTESSRAVKAHHAVANMKLREWGMWSETRFADHVQQLVAEVLNHMMVKP